MARQQRGIFRNIFKEIAGNAAGDQRRETRRRRGFAHSDAEPPGALPDRGLVGVGTQHRHGQAALAKLGDKWNVGILMLWYPILDDSRHRDMLRTLEARFPEGLRHEVRFPPVREGHRMVGSGLFTVNPPWGLEAELGRLAAAFAGLTRMSR